MHVTVRDLMETEICRLSQNASLLEASRQILNFKVSQICVVDENDRFLGVLPDYAILKARMAGDQWDCPVSRYVSRSVAGVPAETELPAVMSLFREGRYETVPVLELNRLVGELKRSAVLEMMLILDPAISEHVIDELENELILESQCELDMMSMNHQDETDHEMNQPKPDSQTAENKIPRPYISHKAKGMISSLSVNPNQRPNRS